VTGGDVIQVDRDCAPQITRRWAVVYTGERVRRNRVDDPRVKTRKILSACTSSVLMAVPPSVLVLFRGATLWPGHDSIMERTHMVAIEVVCLR
jgi:hypothetical protein